MRVFNDILLATDSGRCVALVLLEQQPSTQCTIKILLSRLTGWAFGVVPFSGLGPASQGEVCVSGLELLTLVQHL